MSEAREPARKKTRGKQSVDEARQAPIITSRAQSTRYDYSSLTALREGGGEGACGA